MSYSEHDDRTPISSGIQENYKICSKIFAVNIILLENLSI